MNKKPNQYPMLLNPVYKDYLWGGERLIKEYNKYSNLRPIAESWELSCHPDGLCTVQSGEYKGRTLAELLDEYPSWINPGASGARDFPILIKFIDAKLDLSLQVHPDDAYARKYENSSGKNEAWYVLDCEPEATLILGLKTHMPVNEIKSLLKTGAILDYANAIPVKPDDCYCVPAGLLHAIGGGVLIAEIQQSSNITYRVYDYGRIDADGKPRPLHTARAVEVIDDSLRACNRIKNASARKFDGYRTTELTDWSFFTLSRLDIDGEALLECEISSFHALLIIEGELYISVPKVESASDPRTEPGAGPALNPAFGSAFGSTSSSASSSAYNPISTPKFYSANNLTYGLSIQAIKGSCVFIPAGLGRYMIRGKGRVLLTTV